MTGIENLEEPSHAGRQGQRRVHHCQPHGGLHHPAAFDTIDELRTAVHAVEGADALVSGNSAILDDMLKANTRDSKVIIPVTLVVVLLILMLLLRALAAPLILIAHGRAVLRHGSRHSAASASSTSSTTREPTPSFPLFVFVFLVSLGIDYNIFLMTRVREETMTHGTRKGSLVALSATGGVITSAGLVLAATFGVLASLPLVFLVELGLRRGAGGHHRHDHRALGAGDRDQPRPRRQDLVAEQARPRSDDDQRARRRGPSTAPTCRSTPERRRGLCRRSRAEVAP